MVKQHRLEPVARTQNMKFTAIIVSGGTSDAG